MFDTKGQIILESDSDDDIVLEDALDAGADDLEIDASIYYIITKPNSLMDVRDILEDSGYIIRSAEIEMIPKTLQKLEGQDASSAIKLLDILEDNDDINKLYSNLDVDVDSLVEV